MSPRIGISAPEHRIRPATSAKSRIRKRALRLLRSLPRARAWLARWGPRRLIRSASASRGAPDRGRARPVNQVACRRARMRLRPSGRGWFPSWRGRWVPCERFCLTRQTVTCPRCGSGLSYGRRRWRGAVLMVWTRRICGSGSTMLGRWSCGWRAM